MSRLTGTTHGDAANELMSFYTDQAKSLEAAGYYYMAAVALAFAVETAVLVYLLVEFGPENGGELEIPPSVGFADLIEAADKVGVLKAPIDCPSHVREDEKHPKYLAKDAADKVRLFRNLIHPARALKEGWEPRSFDQKRMDELWEMAESVNHSLMYYL
jgi:hypothetical protein